MQISPQVVLVEKVFVFNCKRFCDSSMRENFKLKPETKIKKRLRIAEVTISIN